MTNMRKTCMVTLMILAAALILAACSGKTEDEAKWPAMDALKEIKAADITSIDYTRGTEGGASSDTAQDPGEIEDIYLRLKDVSIKAKRDISVDDDDLGIKVNTESNTLSFSFEGDILVLEDGTRYEVENLGALKSYIDSLIEEHAQTDGSDPDDTGKGDAEPVKDYVIDEGFQKKTNDDGSIEYLYFNDFMITMPGNEKWSFEANGDSVSFYLFSAQQEGYGGRLVTIQAYDLDDDSYEEMPMPFQVAGVGKNVNKRFIAIYPSDVQYNHNDAQQTADYNDLYDYLKKIGEGAVNSPMQTSDGD